MITSGACAILRFKRKFGGSVVVAYKQRIWGAGKDYQAAWNAARRKKACPGRGMVAFVVIP